MKQDNDDIMSCSEFRDLIRAYMDNELSAVDKKRFLAHAAMCSACALSLREMQYLQKLLRNLPEVNTTPEFDFRLRSSIRIEQQRLKSPSYRFRLFCRDYFKPAVTIPVFAVFLATAAVIHNNTAVNGPSAVGSSQLTSADSHAQPEKVLSFVDNTGEIVYFNYVLEKIQQDEIDSGVFLGHGQASTQEYTPSQNVKLVSF